MAIPMADKSNLERRVLAILDPAVRRARASRGLLAAVAALVFVVSVPLSTIRADDSKSAQIKEAVKVQGDMTPPALVKKVEPKYPPERRPGLRIVWTRSWLTNSVISAAWTGCRRQSHGWLAPCIGFIRSSGSALAV